jgi:hypothetical protein
MCWVVWSFAVLRERASERVRESDEEERESKAEGVNGERRDSPLVEEVLTSGPAIRHTYHPP